jgi:hypothetical protein
MTWKQNLQHRGLANRENTYLKHNFVNKKNAQGEIETSIILFIHRRRLAIQEGSSLLRATGGVDLPEQGCSKHCF